MKVWLEKTNIQKEINKIFDSDDTLANIQNKVLELVNDGMYINFGKFDASCRDNKWKDKRCCGKGCNCNIKSGEHPRIRNYHR